MREGSDWNVVRSKIILSDGLDDFSGMHYGAYMIYSRSHYEGDAPTLKEHGKMFALWQKVNVNVIMKS